MLLLFAVLCSGFPLLAFSDDNLELLSRSLARQERSGCQEVTLSCPQGTTIALRSASYLQGVSCSPGGVTCHLPGSLQYSVLQTVVEKCLKKRLCKVSPPATSYSTDPCPEEPKRLSVTYVCRPYEFRSKTACENEVVQLECGPYFRLAIYSASYGRTQYESLQCPQPQGVPDETCLASYATETVIGRCHGKRRCTLSVDSGTFGTPCKKESRMYLKVVFTCVPRLVLQSNLEQGQLWDEVQEVVDEWTDNEVEEDLAAPNTVGQHNITTNESVTSHHNRGGFEPTSAPDGEDETAGKVRREDRRESTPDELVNCTQVVRPDSRAIGFLSDWITAYHFLSNNKERLILYLTVSVGGGLLCLLLLLVARLAWARRKGPAVDSLPQFEGDLYDGQTDIGFGSALPVDPSDVVRYSTMVPRSLAANSQYYYG